MKTLAQGAVKKDLISLLKVLFQCELIHVFKSASIRVMEKYIRSWNLVLKIVSEPCVDFLW